VIITRTPLRISFAGGGSDLPGYFHAHGGAVVSVTINRYVYVILNDRFESGHRISYTKTELVDTWDEVEHDLVREAAKLIRVKRPTEVVTISDVPSRGSGLGSSSAVTVGLLHAMSLRDGGMTHPARLAQLAAQIEIDILKRPIGYQDQYACASGGLNFFTFGKSGTVGRMPIHLTATQRDKLNLNLMMFFTGLQRDATDVLSEAAPFYEDAAHELKMLAQELKARLPVEGVDVLGECLHRAWMLKKEVPGVSNDHINSLYRAAIDAGAIGGKLLGAGQGGFLLLYVPFTKQNLVREKLQLKELEIAITSEGSQVVFSS